MSTLNTIVDGGDTSTPDRRSAMQHKRYEEVYRGHSIMLEVQEDVPGNWSWYYMIDGRVSLMTGSGLKDAISAAQQGIVAARTRVEEIVNEAASPDASPEEPD